MSIEAPIRSNKLPELILTPEQLMNMGGIAIPDTLSVLDQETDLDTTSELAQLTETDNDSKYQILLSPKDRVEYLNLTDCLIREMVEQRTEVAIFLDKSARPVAWLVMELWDQLQPHLPDGERMPRPEIKFLNIDKEQWGDIIGWREKSGINADKLPKPAFDELKNVFKPPKYQFDAQKNEFVPVEPSDDDTSVLKDKKVMVVDEVRSSGNTLEMAERMINRAYPDAKEIIGRHWMDGKLRVDPGSGVILNSEVPLWYQKKIAEGRLIANRDAAISADSYSYKQRAAGLWLSRGRGDRSRSGSNAPEKPDEKGLQLREDARLLAEDLRNHNLPYIPSALWDDDTESIDSRLERIMGMSVEEYSQLRKDFWDYDMLFFALKTIKKPHESKIKS